MQALKEFLKNRLAADQQQVAQWGEAKLQLQGAATAYNDVLKFLDEAESEGQRDADKPAQAVSSKASGGKRQATKRRVGLKVATVGESDAD